MSHLVINIKVVWIWFVKLGGYESTKMGLLLVFDLCHSIIPSTPEIYNVINVRPTILYCLEVHHCVPCRQSVYKANELTSELKVSLLSALFSSYIMCKPYAKVCLELVRLPSVNPWERNMLLLA